MVFISMLSFLSTLLIAFESFRYRICKLILVAYSIDDHVVLANSIGNYLLEISRG